MGYYGFDYYYLLLVLPAFLISLIAQIKVKTTFSKYSSVGSPLTGRQAAERVLAAAGINNVRIERVSGNLTDHYDPRGNVIRLSDSVFDSNSVSAVGVACHEAGHAVQYAVGYTPIKIRAAVIPACQFGSSFSWIVLILGLVFNFEALIWAGIALFSLVVLFQLITLPVEFDASRRAMSVIRSVGILDDSQAKGARRVLSAAAMTYVAALLVSLAQLVRLILLFGRRND